MQISPRYDGPPVLEMRVAMDDVAQPLLRQRRRLGEFLTKLDSERWTTPSRCDAWSVQDVVTHLVGTNQYWAVSIGAGVRGEPTRYLATFDPVATPAQMVDRLRTLSPSEVLDQYLESVEQLAGVIADLDDERWSLPAEAPPGHIEARVVALHALWDAWIHERDIVLPLGATQDREVDEIAGCLWYAAAIGPTLQASRGSERVGALEVTAVNPDLSFVVHAGSTVTVTDGPPPDDCARLGGDAVALVEGLTFRAPLSHTVDASHAWLLAGLDDVFDR